MSLLKRWQLANGHISIDANREAARARQLRVEIRVARNNRMREYLMALRQPQERGIGDTTERFRKLAEQRGKKALLADLEGLLHLCGCQPQDAIVKLNELHPYD